MNNLVQRLATLTTTPATPDARQGDGEGEEQEDKLGAASSAAD